jgi:hypothetical protein
MAYCNVAASDGEAASVGGLFHCRNPQDHRFNWPNLILRVAYFGQYQARGPFPSLS